MCAAVATDAKVEPLAESHDSKPAPGSTANFQTRRREELANAISHGLAVPLGIAGLAVLMAYAALRGNWLHITTCAVYGSTIVLLFLASTLYHASRRPATKRVLRLLDHACIYLLIAGTYTPFLLVHLGGTLGWTLFGIVWGGAVLGVLFKLKCTGRFEFLSTMSYLLLGWTLVFAGESAIESIPPGGMIWLLAGGIAYTLGVFFYYFDTRLPYGHLVWHLFVFTGATLHYFAVLLYVIPPPTG